MRRGLKIAGQGDTNAPLFRSPLPPTTHGFATVMLMQQTHASSPALSRKQQAPRASGRKHAHPGCKPSGTYSLVVPDAREYAHGAERIESKFNDVVFPVCKVDAHGDGNDVVPRLAQQAAAQRCARRRGRRRRRGDGGDAPCADEGSAAALRCMPILRSSAPCCNLSGWRPEQGRKGGGCSGSAQEGRARALEPSGELTVKHGRREGTSLRQRRAEAEEGCRGHI